MIKVWSGLATRCLTIGTLDRVAIGANGVDASEAFLVSAADGIACTGDRRACRMRRGTVHNSTETHIRFVAS